MEVVNFLTPSFSMFCPFVKMLPLLTSRQDEPTTDSSSKWLSFTVEKQSPNFLSLYLFHSFTLSLSHPVLLLYIYIFPIQVRL